MTIKLLKSLVDRIPDFEGQVEAYRQALLAHRMTVDEPRPLAGHVIESCVRRVVVSDQPDDFVLDYEIEDDTPPPPVPPTLEQRKAVLFDAVTQMEQSALNGVALPIGKRRAHSYRKLDIETADGHRGQAMLTRRAAIAAAEMEQFKALETRRVALLLKPAGTLTADDAAFLRVSEDMGALVAAGRSADDAKFLQDSLDLQAFLTSVRPPEDIQFLADHADRQARSDAIMRHGAELHAQIEDLTAETIAVWQPAEFPK